MSVKLHVHRLYLDHLPPVAPSADGGPVDVEIGEDLAIYWVILLHVASREQAWCLRYDVTRTPRLTLVTYRTEYELVPPPDEITGRLIPALERLTRPRGWLDWVADVLQRWRAGWASRAFSVLWQGKEHGWVATFPTNARTPRAVVLFRTTSDGVRNDGPATSETPN